MRKKYILDLGGEAGNAFVIMGTVARWMIENKYSPSEVDKYYDEARASDYNNLVMVSQKMVTEINKIRGYE